VDGAGAAGADANYLPAFASANGANQTIVLSSTITWGWGDGSTTIYSSASGGDVFVVGKGGDTFFLSGTNNSVVVPNSGVGPTSVVSAATVYGFTDTDHLALGDWSHGSNLSQNATILTPSSSTPINGNNLSWVETLGTLGSYPVYAINVGKVQDDSAATMAAAANKVYSVADLDATFSGSGITQAEGITFIGTDPSGNTVAYGWYNPNTEKGADSNSNHLVDAAEFQGGAILVGVTASNVHASWFN
jgi:hypothetical protein